MPDRAPAPRLSAAFDSPAAKRRYNRRLFATIADRYDFITRFLSFGLDRRWKARVCGLAGSLAGSTTLDLACGTGDIAGGLARAGARSIGLDITPRMLELARARPGSHSSYLVGDMMALPFQASSVDLVTAGYGLRNTPDLAATVAEIHRVLKPGGRLISLDFNRPDRPVVRFLYLTYLTVVGSALGFVLHGEADTYRYIPASIRRYPGARGVVALLSAAGFVDATWMPILGGLMAIHLARKS